MKRPILYSVSLTAVVLLLALVVITSTVAAQRPGRPTPPTTLDRSGSNAKRTPIANAQPTRQRPNAGTPVATFSVPLNITLTPRSTLAAPDSSEEATTIINSFASSYLGVTKDFLYAGTLGAGNTPENWDTLVAQLPDGVQWYMATFSQLAGVSYWGIFKNGMSMTTIGDCTDNPTCTISMDNLNVYLTTASAGIYSVYMSGEAASANDALNMIYSAYPSLKGMTLEPLPADQGYEFQTISYATELINQQATITSRLYLAGVIKIGNQSMVYAVVGIGENYVAMSQ